MTTCTDKLVLKKIDVILFIFFYRLTSAASSTLEDLRTQTTAGFQEAIQNRKQLEVDVNIHSPYIIIPETGHYNE